MTELMKNQFDNSLNC